MRLFKIALFLSLFSFLLSPTSALAQTDSLKTKIENIIKNAGGKIGVTVMSVEDSGTLTINDSAKYPMQSVYKFPHALAVLNQVDKKKISLTKKIRLNKSSLEKSTWSPLRNKYPEGNKDVTLDEILNYTVSESDNTDAIFYSDLLGEQKQLTLIFII